MTSTEEYDLAESNLITFDAALESIQRQILELASAIVAVNYLSAWCASCDLQRVIERAKQYAADVPEVNRPDALRRLQDVLAVADPLIAIAPSTGVIAVLQARSTEWEADRRAWEHEEQQWITARLESRAVLPITTPHRTTRHPETRPDSPRALSATTLRGSASGAVWPREETVSAFFTYRKKRVGAVLGLLGLMAPLLFALIAAAIMFVSAMAVRR